MYYSEGLNFVQPFVTIAIPTYQRLGYLKIAVESALAQTYPNLEILISQDPTKSGLAPDIRTWTQNIVNQQSRVRYQANAYNFGLAGNWNAAAAAASGEYIVIIGDDDLLLPGFIETLVNAAQSHPQVIFSNHFIINSEGNRLVEDSYQWTQRYHRDQMPPGLLTLPESWVWQNSIPMLSALIRTETVRHLKFKEDLNTPEIELFLRIAQAGGDFVFVPEYLAEYRVHQQSATSAGRGLRSDKLVNHLLALPVSPEIEQYKQAYLSQVMVNAVSQCLLDGQTKQAQAWLKSQYYPQNHRRRIDGILQYLCATLPGDIGVNIYKQLHSAKKAFR
jgi:glycosyltransferase involved in cell wall biosynthesis